MTFNNKLALPKDLYDCEERMLNSLLTYLSSEGSNRIQLNLIFEGLKIEPLFFREMGP